MKANTKSASSRRLSAGKKSDNAQRSQRSKDAFRPRLNWVSDLKPKNVEWLVPKYIVANAVNEFNADPDQGKTLAAMDLAACVSSGRAWFGGEPGAMAAGKVAYFNTENDPETVLAPRLIAADGDIEKICFFGSNIEDDATGGQPKPLRFPDPKGFVLLEQIINSIGDDLKLVVFDMLDSYIATKANTISSNHMRQVVDGLSEIARECRITILVLRHLNKNSGESNPLYRASGSVALTGAARAAYVVGTDNKTEPDLNPRDRRRLLAPVKLNVGRKPDARAFQIEELEIQKNGEPIKTIRLKWDPTPILNMNAAEMLSTSHHDEDTKINQAARLIDGELRKNGGWQLKQLIENPAKQEGIDDRTLGRARARLGALSDKVTNPGDKSRHDAKHFTVWWLPEVTGPNFKPQNVLVVRAVEALPKKKYE